MKTPSPHPLCSVLIALDLLCLIFSDPETLAFVRYPHPMSSKEKGIESDSCVSGTREKKNIEENGYREKQFLISRTRLGIVSIIRL